jgi:hypothetical protein
MLYALPILVLGFVQTPDPSRDFAVTGIPSLSGDGAMSVSVPTHSATIELRDDRTARVTSVTQFKNTLDRELKLSVRIPWKVVSRSSSPRTTYRSLKATWNDRDLPLVSTMIFPPTGASAEVVLPANATGSLKVSLDVPVGRTGPGFDQRVVGYALTGDQTIGQLNLTYKYQGNLSGRETFRLPQTSPDLGWKVGDRGAFVRLSNYQPTGDVTAITFYSGGFDEIGNYGK